MASMRKQMITKWVDAYGKRVPPNTPGAQKVQTYSRKYYAFDVPGSSRPIPLASKKTVAQTLFARLIAGGEADLAGLASAADRGKSVSQWIDDYEKELIAREHEERNRRMAISLLRRIADELRWTSPPGLTATAVRDWLTGLDAAATRNHYRRILRTFIRWLAAKPRKLVPGDMLDDVPQARKNPTRLRRSLTVTQLGAVLAAALASAGVFKRLDGRTRHALYAAAAGTGLRARELASLTPSHFDFDASPPVVHVSVRRDKARRKVVQPLPLEIAALLRSYCEGRRADELLWPGWWYTKAAEVLRVDLETAGIPYTVTSPDGPLHADFHSLRYTYVHLLQRAGVSLADAMQLARHTDPKLTLALYGKSQLEELGREVAALPILPSLATNTPEELEPFWKLFAWLLACAAYTPAYFDALLSPESGKEPDGPKQ